MWVIILLFLAVFVFYCLFLRFSREGRLIAKIPGPKGLPILGNAFTFILSTDKLFQYSRRLYKEHKGLIQLHSFGFRCVNLYEPEDIEKILSSVQFNEKNVPYNFLKPWLQEGLLVSNGPKWQYRRKMLTPAFHFNVLKRFSQMFAEYTEELLNEIDAKGVINNPIDLQALIMPITLKIICEISMGLSKEYSMNLVADKYVEAIETMSNSVVQRLCRVWYFFDTIYNNSISGRKQKRIIKDIHAFTKNIIKHRRKMLSKSNQATFSDSVMYGKKGNLAMLDLLLENEKEMKIDGNGIREEVDTFVFEGYDTTATALVFLIMRIANEPEVQKKLHEEFDRIFSSSTRLPTIADLNEMKYTECCIKESLRIYPSVPFISRTINKETVLSGYTIPSNTQANIMIYDLHNREDIYPEAKKFIPERFLPENLVKRHNYAYIPFSAGPRNCLGQKFAMLEMKTIISGLLRRYQFEPVTTPEDMVFITNMMLRTKDPIYVRFNKRNR